MSMISGHKMIPDSPGLLGTATGILKTLAYFDIFHYPLSKEDIIQFMPHTETGECMQTTLNKLVEDHRIFLHQDFYSLQNNPLLACKRIKGNQRAMELLPSGLRIGRFLYRLPFVRAIAISGSLSKNFADERADIDFFIITKANRLWIARTIMHLFKKLTFLTGRQHYYCMNYYTDEEALLLEDKNIFTAMEVKTLLPVSGEKVIQEFFKINEWTNQWLPACPFRKQAQKDKKELFLKRIIEWCCNGGFGEYLDNYLQRITTNRWNRKQERGERNEKGYPMGLMTGKHYARSNPGAFQEKVLTLYNAKIASLG